MAYAIGRSTVVALVAVWCALLIGSVRAAEVARSSEIGLSSEGLDRLTRMLEAEVDQGRIVGAVAAIARCGRIGYLQAVGQRDRESESPMLTDTVFRIASMSKPVTSCGVLMLRDEGLLELDDPVDKFLPEFQRMTVWSTTGDSGTVPADRIPTVRELLTHTSGLTYGWFGPPELDDQYQREGISDFLIPSSDSLADRVRRASQIPLKHQPGTAWEYGISTDVLGRVIEIVSGLTLEQFFHERIFRPLGMRDTHFYVPPDKHMRLAALYTPGADGILRRVGSQPIQAGNVRFSANYCLQGQGQCFSGGAGLVSTATDYLRFLQMLLNGGQLSGQRFLQPESVVAMTSNQIGPLMPSIADHGDGFGYGFGVVSPHRAEDDVASAGTYSWGGIFNTYFWCDPSEQMIGVLMTQVFPFDHLTLRKRFQEAAYQAIDDAGFKRLYWYEKGVAHGNPYFNARQLRVNAAEASVHPTYSTRSEPRSSGTARILINEDLRRIQRAQLYAAIWGGHPGTLNKSVSINGRSKFFIPDVGTGDGHCTHQYVTLNLRPSDLVNGYNSLQFSCEQGDSFWGHYIVDNVALMIGLPIDDPRLEPDYSRFKAIATCRPRSNGEGFILGLQTDGETRGKIKAVHFQAKYRGYDENGDGRSTDWHGMTREKLPYAIVGSASNEPFQLDWDTSMLPDQDGVVVRAFIQFEGQPDIVYQSSESTEVSIAHDGGQQVVLYEATNQPKPFWSRAGRLRECEIAIDIDPADIVAAELHVVAWTGGAGEVQDYFTLNGQALAVAEGDDHRLVYSRLSIDPQTLRQGANSIRLLSDTEHHGIEIMRPGPALAMRFRKGRTVNLLESARDASASGLECYRIQTPTATYYLDKIGGGLSSIMDAEGHNWISFKPDAGSGASGEYRGFPNAVFKEEGSYFHPRNQGTDPSVSVVETVEPDRVVISVTSGNGKWAGRYTFTPESCVFTMLRMPPDRNYWILYEGTPGGEYNDDDWWMTSAVPVRTRLTQPHEGDIPAPEWIAFGDPRSAHALFIAHLQDDDHPDRFYQMEQQMTVFGFGRNGMQKFLDTVPNSFAIGIVNASDRQTFSDEIVRRMELATVSLGSLRQGSTSSSQPTINRGALEQFALTAQGDPEAGRRLFSDEQRTRCLICHKVGDQGGEVGPDLSKIGGKFDRPHLIESLLQPSQQIVEGYRTSVLVTKSGQVVSGIVKSRDTGTLRLVDANAQCHVISESDLEESVDTSASLMPEGLADALSPQEFADLIAYLETLRTGNAKFGSNVAGPIQLPEGFEISTIVTGLTGATALETLPDGRIFVCEQNGNLRVVKNGQLLPRPFATLPVQNYWERGLIGVTVSPKFPQDPWVYVVYVAGEPYPHHRISRLLAEGDIAVSGSEQILLRGDDQGQMGGNVPAGHQGGGIHFGNDGKLFIGIGEQTAASPSQKLNTFLGKIVRINADGTIPTDNPLLDQTEGKYQAIWALGCRNPFTFAIEPSTGRMLINDVGGDHEEINPGRAGANYGWPVVDHGQPHGPGFVGPIHSYPQASIAGGDFLPAGLGWPHEFENRYFFGDFVHGWIHTLDVDHPSDVKTFVENLRRLVDMRFSPDGSLYVLVRNAWVVDDKFVDGTGSIVQIRPASPSND